MRYRKNSIGTKPKTLLDRVLSGLVLSFLSEAATRAAALVAMLLIARAIGPESFGEFTFVFTAVTFVWIGIDLGLSLYGTRELAKSEACRDTVLSVVSTVRFLQALFIAGLCMLVMIVVGVEEHQKILLLSMSVYLLGRALFPDWFFRGTEQYLIYAFISFCTSAVLVLVAVVVVKLESPLPYVGLPWAIAYVLGVAGGVVAIYNSGGGIKISSALNIKEVTSAVRSSIPFTYSNVITLLYQQVPFFFVFLASGAAAGGEFAVVFRVVLGGIFLLSIIPMAVYPIFTDLFSRGDARFTYLLCAIVLAVGLVGVFAFFVGKQHLGGLIVGVLGKEYIGSSKTLELLLVFFLMRSIRAVFVRAINAAGFEVFYAKVCLNGLLALVFLVVVVFILRLEPNFYSVFALVLVETGVLFVLIKLTVNHVIPRLSNKEPTDE